jgi:transposase-like protein
MAQVNVTMIGTNEFTKRLRGEVRSGIAGRRRWTAAEKGWIVAEAVGRGADIAEVARRHDLTQQHLWNRVRAVRQGRLILPAPEDGAEAGMPGVEFFPVVTTQVRRAVPAASASFHRGPRGFRAGARSAGCRSAHAGSYPARAEAGIRRRRAGFEALAHRRGYVGLARLGARTGP